MNALMVIKLDLSSIQWANHAALLRLFNKPRCEIAETLSFVQGSERLCT